MHHVLQAFLFIKYTLQFDILFIPVNSFTFVPQVRVRDARERTSEARQGVDGVTLQLQNLLYEVAHLKKEVRRCLDFQSADQEIDLVPVEQFYIEAPEDISRPVSHLYFVVSTLHYLCHFQSCDV